VAESPWSLDATTGELLIRTGVAGPAAKMGHRLTIAMTSWQADVRWRAGKPVHAELTVVVDSLQVIKGDGGVTPLSGPEKSVARFNALKSLDAKKFPQIRFTTDDIATAPQGYRLTGTVEIHGTSRAQVIDLAVEDTDAWAISAHAVLAQSGFSIKPYSLLMGSLRVADEVTIEFTARHPK
jgi:polyisoprenoid-binding protein YceI